MKPLLKLTHWCLDLIFPKYCLGCGLEGSYLCPACFSSIPVCLSTNCFICGRRSPSGLACDNCRHKERSSLNGIMVAADWKNLLLRQIIYEYKYRFVKELSIPLSQLMISFLQTDMLLNCPPDKLILVPVPLHGRRFAWRGFNQAELLAQKISAHFDIPLAKNILVRSRHTLPQRTAKTQVARAANIKNAFTLSKNHSSLSSLRAPQKRDDVKSRARKAQWATGLYWGDHVALREAIPRNTTQNLNSLKNKTVILVDDICTTGLTFEDCARALKSLSPKEIWGLVIARG
ncbi:hypothetical protein KJ784_01395 [Patescibacteria group bacterium]|nr:hypothetical protein [Patescibacteria group bacterium]MBU2264823.1 hypothetical protein [Patescibacteria group bacterium]